MASTHKSTTNGLPKMAREADLSKAHQHIHTFSLSRARSLSLSCARVLTFMCAISRPHVPARPLSLDFR